MITMRNIPVLTGVWDYIDVKPDDSTPDSIETICKAFEIPYELYDGRTIATPKKHYNVQDISKPSLSEEDARDEREAQIEIAKRVDDNSGFAS